MGHCAAVDSNQRQELVSQLNDKKRGPLTVRKWQNGGWWGRATQSVCAGEKGWGWNANFWCLFRAAGFGMDDMNDELCCILVPPASLLPFLITVCEREYKERGEKQQQQPGMFPLINPHTSTSPTTTNGNTHSCVYLLQSWVQMQHRHNEIKH